MLKEIVMTAALFALAGAAFAGEAKAEAKHVVRQFGGIEITALLERNGQGNLGLLVGAGEEDIKRANQPGGMANSINAFLVRMNGKTMLFDAGLPTGAIVAALAEAGCKPEDIDVVLITHFHGDHVGGLVKDGKPVYPKAELYVPKTEVDRWSGGGTEFLAIYQPNVYAFDWGREALPGVEAIKAQGHTPGHTVFRLESGGGKVLIIGDLIHFGGVQLANPDVAVTYDVDPIFAVRARKEIFAQAAAEGIAVASMHLPFPGIGVLKADGKGYAFVGATR